MRKTLRIISVISAVLLLSGFFACNVNAATQNYDFYPTTTSDNLDSHGASKAGGTKYENCAYITPSYFSKTGNVRFWVQGNGVTTERITISSGGVNVARHPYYATSAPSGGTYYVGGKVSSISSGTSMRVKGAFTP